MNILMFYKICRSICYLVVILFWSLKIKGENIDNYKGPIIIAANHVSYLDPIIVGISVKRPINFIAKKEVFDVPILGYILRKLGVIPVDKKNTNPTSIKKTITLLKEGHILGIFPEGTRSLDGKLLKLNSGIIKIALQTNAPIIPIGLNGTFDVYPPHAKIPAFFKRKNIYVNFGKPIYLDSSRRKDAEYLKESLQKIENEIKELAQLSSKNNVYANSSEVKLYANRK
ncbi:MAG: lysophospholipid acyltransferase family protein [Candidatus Caldatribacteriota bacterium]|nr:1-acyl-sn-glycerol-3-phosphate acyltransferase [Candidatus Atribacteria bacterium]MDD3538589.1 lysophospholipid acyltransferase family protein [Atribacterota bacterium]